MCFLVSLPPPHAWDGLQSHVYARQTLHPWVASPVLPWPAKWTRLEHSAVGPGFVSHSLIVLHNPAQLSWLPWNAVSGQGSNTGRVKTLGGSSTRTLPSSFSRTSPPAIFLSLSFFFFFSLFLNIVLLGIKPKVLGMLGKHQTMEVSPYPLIFLNVSKIHSPIILTNLPFGSCSQPESGDPQPPGMASS